MQKVIAVFAAIILALTVLVVPASADEFEAQFIDYIAESYELKADKIILEGTREHTFEHLGRKLLVGYFFTDEEPYIKGQVAMDQSSGKFITEEELQNLLTQEWEYVVAENERLQAEAGKMSVWFYRELLSRDAKELISVHLIPRFELTADLEARIRALYAEYDMDAPRDLRPDMDAPRDLRPDMDRNIKPGSEDSGAGFDEGQSEPGNPGSIDPEPPDTDLSGREPALAPLPLPVQPADSDLPADIVDGDEPVSSDDDGQRLPMPEPYLEEFYTELTELYVEGYQLALERLSTDLKAQGVKFEVQNAMLVAELTVAQALAMRNHSDIEWLGDLAVEEDFHILPANLRTGQESSDDLAADADGSGAAENKGRYWLWGTLMAAAVAAVVWVVKR